MRDSCGVGIAEFETETNELLRVLDDLSHLLREWDETRWVEWLERDRALLRELDLVLCCTLETHVHADHVTAAGLFRKEIGSKVVTGAQAGVQNADIELQDGESSDVGEHSLEAMLTPGHTLPVSGSNPMSCAKVVPAVEIISNGQPRSRANSSWTRGGSGELTMKVPRSVR